jgi:hypothetical protein
MHTGFWWGNLNEIDQIKDLGVAGRLLFKCVLKGEVGREWTVRLAEDGYKWRILVLTVLQNAGHFLSS